MAKALIPKVLRVFSEKWWDLKNPHSETVYKASKNRKHFRVRDVSKDEFEKRLSLLRNKPHRKSLRGLCH